MQFQHFNDFDAFTASVRDVNSTMMLQNPKHYSWSIYHVNLPEIHLQGGRLGSGNIVEGQSKPNGYLLYLPLTYPCEYSANGTVLDKDSFLILEPGSDICLSSTDEHDWCSIFVPSHKLIATRELVEPSSGSERSEQMKCRVSRPNPQLAQQFRTFVSRIMNAAGNCSQIESGPAAKVAAAEALKISSLVLGQRQGDETSLQGGRPRLPRQEIIRCSKDLLEESDGEPVLVSELAAAVGVSERTLRRAFNYYFGIGPARYLQLRQLNQVRSALRSAEPEAVSVRDVLLRYGVWEFGRFASRYRRLFGELPSETLRRRRR